MILRADYRFIVAKVCHEDTKTRRNTKVLPQRKELKEDTQRLCFVGNCRHEDTNVRMIVILGISWCGRLAQSDVLIQVLRLGLCRLGSCRLGSCPHGLCRLGLCCLGSCRLGSCPHEPITSSNNSS